jgi:hypothetical protein
MFNNVNLASQKFTNNDQSANASVLWNNPNTRAYIQLYSPSLASTSNFHHVWPKTNTAKQMLYFVNDCSHSELDIKQSDWYIHLLLKCLFVFQCLKSDKGLVRCHNNAPCSRGHTLCVRKMVKVHSRLETAQCNQYNTATDPRSALSYRFKRCNRPWTSLPDMTLTLIFTASKWWIETATLRKYTWNMPYTMCIPHDRHTFADQHVTLAELYPE